MNFLYNILSPKTSYDDSGLLFSSTDVHCHILPGVDDGVATYDEAVNALRWLKKRGVRHIYLTPHVMADYSCNTYSYLSNQFSVFVKKLADDMVEDIPDIRLAAEYMLDAAFVEHKKEGLLTYSNKNVLVETSYMMPPIGMSNILEELLEDGYMPVLAHPERYVYMQEQDYDIIKEQGIMFQLNYLSLTGIYGNHVVEKANKLIKKGYYNYTGSDFHLLSRYEDSFYSKVLSRQQIISLQRLFFYNESLW